MEAQSGGARGPVTARVLLLAVIVSLTALAGGAWLAFLLSRAGSWDTSSLLNTGVFAILTLAAGLFPLPVAPRVKATVTTAPLFAGVLFLEPANAALAALVGSMAYQAFLRWTPAGVELPLFKFPFNAGEVVLSTGGASYLFHVLGGGVPSAALPFLPAAAAMYLLNTGLVSLAAAAYVGQTPVRIWWDGTRDNGPAEAALYAFGLVGAIAYAFHPLYLTVLGVPVAVIYLTTSRLAAANARLERALAELRELEGRMLSTSKLASVGALSLDLAHQVRNPLFIVIARLERLQSRLEGSTALRADADRALEGALRIQQLTDNLLALARHQWVAIDIGTIVEDAIGMVSSGANRRSAVLRSLPADLPPIQGNPILLREALSNLVANALEASSEGASVQVRATRSDGIVVIEVTDSGIGISVEDLGRLFEPFRTSKPEGLGLGLFSAKHIVGMHGGSLEVQSQQGKGTVVTVRLPIEQPSA